MTVRELRLLLKGLKGDTPVMMPLDEDRLVSVCAQNSGVAEMEMQGDEDEISDSIPILLLVGCNCSEELPEGSINSQPELN